jgi:uncharacterized oxidoreductase
MSDGVVLQAGALRRFAAALVEAMGADAEVATEVARHLVGANLAGHDSHGVIRLAQYAAAVEAGTLRPGARARLLLERGAVGLFDAGCGFGHHSTMVAVGWAAKRAQEMGVGAAAVRHSTHIGRLGEYTERLAGEGLVGIVTVGAAGADTGRVAPFGGAAPRLGTNPWSIAVPSADQPMVYDGATSTVSEGKVRLAWATGRTLPEGALLDPEGRPATDPEVLYRGGTLTPLGGAVGGHKGYGLGLAAALVGGLAMIGDTEPTAAGCMREPDAWGVRLAGVLVVAIDPAAFGDAGAYRRQVAGVLEVLAASPPATGVDRVLVPGEPERRSRRRREAEGIPVPGPVWAELDDLARRYRVSLP